MQFTKDGSVVEYDFNEPDPNLRITGDPELAFELFEALSGDRVKLAEPDWFVEFDTDTPIRNAVAAAMSLGFDLNSDGPELDEWALLQDGGGDEPELDDSNIEVSDEFPVFEDEDEEPDDEDIVY